MSGDVQPRKRKDKKRKKDDEDTVKETPAPKVTAGAAQAATQPGDIQMHVHNDHGTGGHWCAKVVFFILLTGLGALIGLIILENRGVSNADTPLSESRYAEYFDGWVDENREDDHHHEEILEALNQLDEHEDEDEAHGEADDHGDEEDEDDGAPYAEEEDHDDERDLQDEEDEGELPKLDDDEVEEIVATEKKVAQHEARAAADNDDDDDEPVATGNANDDDDDDEPDNQTAEDDDDENDSIAKEINQLAEDDDDDDTVEGNSPFDEENQTNALNDHVNKSTDGTVLRKEREIEKTVEVEAYAKDETPADPMVSAEVLKTQMDELVNTYNKLAEKMNLPKEEPFDKVGTKHVNNKDDDDQVNDDTFSKKAVNDKDDGDQDDDEDDDEDNFENFVDNDGGEEEYLAKLRKEQEQRNQQKQQEEKDEPREESSQIPSRPSESQIYEEELDRARRHLDELKNPKKALEEYETLLRKSRRLVPALVGKARALDVLAEQKQSNSLLSEAIEAYRDVVLLGDAVDDETARTAGERCIDRSRFRGQYLQVVDVHQELIRRFDSEPKYRNQLAVTYLLANRLPEAKAVLHETLMRWIDDGFALVHYGFVLKNLDKDMELAAQYLREGIETEQEGTQDGRFYFHLGDALQRLGRQQEALDVYRKGAEKKLFLSMYQRSLYNVDSLKSRPFWTVEQTTFAAQLELIRSQWTGIRDEGLKLLNSAGNFKDEAENLRDTGDWKQFELFFRGYRIDKNCAKAPLTCRLVEQFTAARSCKRGQVKFSVMHPGTHVWPHCGPTNCRIRAHLGLKVPSGTSIRVAEETRSWENGKWLIFDDSFEHEVWHNGTSTRLVLIVDFWHPDLTESQRKSLSPI
uniref:Putative aspartyl beta-hydroxylase n=1 Tax=Aedes aegypti TaxID=7159 RepID=A0A0P6IXZ1_AEDAE